MPIEQMLINKINYEPHLNNELLTGAFIENQFKKLCIREIYYIYSDDYLIDEYFKYRRSKVVDYGAFKINMSFARDYIGYINKGRITCKTIPITTYVYNTLLREPRTKELMPHDDASLILDKIECFFDINYEYLASFLEDSIYSRYLKNDDLY